MTVEVIKIFVYIQAKWQKIFEVNDDDQQLQKKQMYINYKIYLLILKSLMKIETNLTYLRYPFRNIKSKDLTD